MPFERTAHKKNLCERIVEKEFDLSMNQVAQSKYWVFTLNNPPSNEVPGEWPKTEWVVWQRERGENGTEHLQGYAIFETKQRLTALKKINKSAHWEPRRGNHAQAKAYATKDDTRIDGPWECGEEPADKEQGKRNDLLALKRKLDEGATEAAIAADPDLFPVWARHHKVVARYKMLTGKQRDWPVFTQVIWGAPGLGKTRKALELAGPAAYWLPRPAGQTSWFDGYIGQDTIVIDEFYGWLSLDLLCRILDRYPFQVETKGGSQPLLVRKVIITSNVAPLQWYPKVPQERLRALWRRLEMPLGAVEHMLQAWTPPPPPEIQNGVLQQPLLYADEPPLWPDEIGGDHLGPVIDVDPNGWIDVMSGVPGPYYGAQR